MFKKSIYNFKKSDLIIWLSKYKYKKYRAIQIWFWLYIKLVLKFKDMKNLPKKLIILLNKNFIINSLYLVKIEKSYDGTIKYLFKLFDGYIIETVIMFYKFGISICLSTQVGCKMGCSFCINSKLKFYRNLIVDELISQIIFSRILLKKKNKNIVIMGIGEPFDNFKNLINFLNIIIDKDSLNFNEKNITISTCGIVPKIFSFIKLKLKVNLAISLHASNDILRNKLMKINYKFSLAKLFNVIDIYIKKIKRRITFEYIMINNINDNIFYANELSKLLKNKKKFYYVNLILYNENNILNYKRSSKKNILIFLKILKKNGINCCIRNINGFDIQASCGQLKYKYLK